jgi:hypothetical protein
MTYQDDEQGRYEKVILKKSRCCGCVDAHNDVRGFNGRETRPADNSETVLVKKSQDLLKWFI